MAIEKITVEAISNKEFTYENRGYNRREVDEYLDAICDEMERMEGEIKDLKQQTVTIPVARPADSGTDPSALKEILEMAMKVKDETIRKAQEDAEAIRAKAQIAAEEHLDDLGEEREKLKAEIAALKEVAADYRAKFEALLQAQQDALDKATDLF